MKIVRIFLLVLIIIGIGLLVTQKMWVPKIVDKILKSENINTDPTTNWKTGKSWGTNHDFTFKYPPDWKLEDVGKNDPRPGVTRYRGIWVVPPDVDINSSQYKDVIVVHIEENRCNNLLDINNEPLKNCVESTDGYTYIVLTESKRADVLEVFNELVKTFNMLN